jgi:hypothetical protein
VRILLFGGYGLAILVLLNVLLVRTVAPAPPLIATRALAAGHQLMPGDAALAGGPHYVQRSIAAGAGFGSNDLSSVPRLLPASKLLTVAIPVAAAARFEVGDRGWLCPASVVAASVPAATPSPVAKVTAPPAAAPPAPTPAAVVPDPGPVTVAAVMCDARGVGSCLALVGLPPERAAVVATTPQRLYIEPCKGGK